MVDTNMGVVPADPKQEKDLQEKVLQEKDLQERDLIDGGTQRPMSQQDAAGSHGHEMHPQKFVRLVGCHESNAAKNPAVQPPR